MLVATEKTNMRANISFNRLKTDTEHYTYVMHQCTGYNITTNNSKRLDKKS
jgi:hypothetical protein